jgi:bifunctional non-homologous end joining protein LigD
MRTRGGAAPRAASLHDGAYAWRYHLGVLPRLAPLPLERRRDAFDDTRFVYELKYDGFRALAFKEGGKVQLVSRRAHVYHSYPGLCLELADSLKAENAIVDGELVVLDDEGRPQFYPLLHREQEPCFVAFDLLWLNGHDQRQLPLLERKRRLRRVIPRRSACVIYLGHVPLRGVQLFDAVVANDLEGIVAKPAASTYSLLRDGRTPWVKMKNAGYSQAEGRHDFFAARRFPRRSRSTG